LRKLNQKSQIPEILEEYGKFCEIRKNSLELNKIDLSKYDWFYPTCLLPLCNLMFENSLHYTPPSSENVSNYISVILSSNNINKSYIPLLQLPHKYSEVGRVIDRLQILCNDGEDFGGKTAFSYLLNEMIDNIYQHSNFERATVMAQVYKTKGFVEISIYDDGISIPGSFEKFNIEFKHDSYAIQKAINGTSTKDDDRGHGLNSSTNMYIEGGGAEVLLVSRNGFFHKKKGSSANLFNAGSMYGLKGTLIGIRLPYPVSKIPAHKYY
jgi:hypothetical protein